MTVSGSSALVLFAALVSSGALGRRDALEVLPAVADFGLDSARFALEDLLPTLLPALSA
jgi:hypothetical protein